MKWFLVLAFALPVWADETKSPPPATQVAERTELDKLRRENVALKKQIVELTAQVEKLIAEIFKREAAAKRTPPDDKIANAIANGKIVKGMTLDQVYAALPGAQRYSKAEEPDRTIYRFEVPPLRHQVMVILDDGGKVIDFRDER